MSRVTNIDKKSLPTKESATKRKTSNSNKVYSKPVTKLSALEARDFFLKSSSYVSISLPYYITFDELLSFISSYIGRKDVKQMCKANDKTTSNPSNYPNVNRVILSSKGKPYAWRPLQIIHPVLYVHLVKLMTQKENWAQIQSRFNKFAKSYVECISIPRESDGVQSDVASLVKFWWESIEQESIKKSLEYSYLYKTDISDCYGSIYTHSIEWALDEEGMEAVKERLRNKVNRSSLGKDIDKSIRSMSYNQTNGIPQGSVLMDFIAEIVLGYADERLTEEIRKKNINKKDFSVLRYRDDYRIFVNNPNIGQEIMHSLNAVLYSLGMRLNSEKTSDSSEIILSSIKDEKLERILISPSIIDTYLQKEALRIYQISKKYPSSGIVSKELNLFYDILEKKEVIDEGEDLEVLITIFTMIGYHSPKVINWVCAVISKLFEYVEDKVQKRRLIRRIHNRFIKTSKIDLVDIWLQRISAPLQIPIGYNDDLTKVVAKKKKNSILWNCDWLDENLVVLIDSADISRLNEELEENAIAPAIQRSEVELFKIDYF